MTHQDFRLIALVGAIFAMGSLGVDAMLPALMQIAEALVPGAPNLAQMIITGFVIGMGFGAFAGGPLADRYGRRPMILTGAALYGTGATLAMIAPTLALAIAARSAQGIGAAIASSAIMATVRDLHSGARMARVMSFAGMVFALMPAIAPMIGQEVMAFGGWRSIFLVYAGFGLLILIATTLWQPETLAARRSLSLASYRAMLAEAWATHAFRRALILQILGMAALFATLANIQPIFDQAFHRAETFTRWFALIALTVFCASFLNGLLVGWLGMVRLLRLILAGQAVNACLMLALLITKPTLGFAVFLLTVFGVFLTQGLSSGNLMALALEPLGHAAGTAGSILQASAMMIGAGLGVPVSLLFDGTPRPLVAMLAGMAVMSMLVVRGLVKHRSAALV